MSLDEEVDILRRIPLFSNIDPAKLKLMAFASERMTYHDGQPVVRQGETGDAAYVILEGKADVSVDTLNGPLTVASLGRNDIVGDIAILIDIPRTATVTAKGELVTLKLTKELFQIVREVRILDERLDLYNSSSKAIKNKGNVFDRRMSQSAEIVLRGYWVDLKDGGVKSPGSVYGLATTLGYASLPDLFFERRFGQHLQHGVLALLGQPEFIVEAGFQRAHALLEFLQLLDRGLMLRLAGDRFQAFFQPRDALLQMLQVDRGRSRGFQQGITLYRKTAFGRGSRLA